MIIINYLVFLDDVLCVRRDERQKYQQGKPQYSVVEDKWTGHYLERKCQNISISDSFGHFFMYQYSVCDLFFQPFFKTYFGTTCSMFRMLMHRKFRTNH